MIGKKKSTSSNVAEVIKTRALNSPVFVRSN